MNRRAVLIGGIAGGSVAALGTGALTFRLHKTPHRRPALTEDHLATLGDALPSGLRVLFIGNSLVVGHKLPQRVADKAAADGLALHVAMAAASGAHLVETLRINAFRAGLDPDFWDAVVVQDFTETALTPFDRWGSRIAIQRIARAVNPAPIILYPPFPGRAGHRIYRRRGLFSPAPSDPADYAAQTSAHYKGLADRFGYHYAPVPERWLAADDPGLYAGDGHHASAAGADFIADVLWEVIGGVLARS